ncbi:MAG TPA: DUF6600 domain-containing protein, partial [Polyangiaceae bacterium]|nr:DUF6600 domain-containing protein [Polyangiaceae bacterium]
LGTLLPSGNALAQEADDNGWFDEAPPAPEPAPQPYYTEPSVNGADPTPAPVQQTEVEDTDPSALTTFRPALDPYGTWVTDSTYGTVWVPNRDVVGADFAPYVSRGRWSLTADNDWIWASDYPFGWAVFHYGRWVWTPGGWAWVPGRTYANAWVVWRVPSAGYAYVGWAPMPPTWGWRHGYAFGLGYAAPLPYVFCPSAYVFDYRVHSYIVHDRAVVRDIAVHSRVYPTPYRAPAQPSMRMTSLSSRPERIAPSTAPRGPAMSAARVPSQAIPSQRTSAPARAVALSGNRLTSGGAQRDSFRSSAAAQLRGSRVRPDMRESAPRDAIRRSAPSSSWSTAPRSTWSSAPRSSWSSAPRSSAPSNFHVDRPSASPSRIRVSPSMSHSFSPAPSRSVAPVRSFSPSFHMHGGGGGGRRR